MTEPVISLSGLEKRYGDVRALDRLSLEVPPGPVGLLGPNGAGKTTLIKLLLGLLEPDSGQAEIAGYDPRRRGERLRIREVVGYMPEGDCLLPGMTGVELASTLARLTGLSKEDAMTRAHEVLDYVELEEQRYRRLEEYSTGMKQRLKLAQALVHDPPLLLLDEPTNGLDPKGRRHMLSLIHDLGHAQGKNVLICSHLLPDVERACDHVVVLDRGRVVEQGDIAEMTASDGLRQRMRVEPVAAGDSDAIQRFTGALSEAGYAIELHADGHLTVQTPEKATDADRLFALALVQGVTITALDEVRSSLEEVFLRAVEGPTERTPVAPGSAGGARP